MELIVSNLQGAILNLQGCKYINIFIYLYIMSLLSFEDIKNGNDISFKEFISFLKLCKKGNTGSYELLFNKPVDKNRDYDIQKFSELIQKKHQELQQEKEQEKILYGKIRTLNDLIFEKHNFKIYKYDTHLNLSFKLQSSLDIYEIFNKFKPSIRLPFFHAKDFNKCLNNFILREDWIKNFIEDEIYFYVKISDYQENYAKCIFSDVKYENQTYYFDLDIQIEKSYFETLSQRLDLFIEVVKYLPDFLKTLNLIFFPYWAKILLCSQPKLFQEIVTFNGNFALGFDLFSTNET
jgi:hypothetical protein